MSSTKNPLTVEQLQAAVNGIFGYAATLFDPDAPEDSEVLLEDIWPANVHLDAAVVGVAMLRAMVDVTDFDPSNFYTLALVTIPIGEQPQ